VVSELQDPHQIEQQISLCPRGGDTEGTSNGGHKGRVPKRKRKARGVEEGVSAKGDEVPNRAPLRGSGRIEKGGL